MRAEDENAFDVASATWPRDEGNEAGEVLAVTGLEQLQGIGKIGDELAAAGEHDVMGREHGQRATASAARGEEHAAGLSDKRVAFGNAGIAGFQLADVVGGVGEAYSQSERAGGDVG